MRKGPPPRPPEDRFWLYVLKASAEECWLWTGGNNGVYGVFTVDGRRAHTRREYAHRFSYEMHVGEIPDGLVIDHLCRTPLCVNPNHLEPVTRRENLLRSPTERGKRGRRETCARGHLLAGDNLRVHANGTRHCLTCLRMTSREYMRRKRAERRAALAAGDDIRVPHGTESAYTNFGCRCEDCRQAGSEAGKRRRGTLRE